MYTKKLLDLYWLREQFFKIQYNKIKFSVENAIDPFDNYNHKALLGPEALLSGFVGQ